MKVGQQVTVCDYHGATQPYNAKVVTLYTIEELDRKPVDEANAGEIVCFSGIENVTIGETLCDPEHVEPLPFVKISEPTVEMTFSVNDSPFAGKEGKFVTSRHLRERLFRELLKDVSLRVNETDTTDSFRVCGRGEMHLSILIENLRREGYEFQVGAPQGAVQGNRRRQVRAGRAHDRRRAAGRGRRGHGEDGQPQGRAGLDEPQGLGTACALSS